MFSKEQIPGCCRCDPKQIQRDEIDSFFLSRSSYTGPGWTKRDNVRVEDAEESSSIYGSKCYHLIISMNGDALEFSFF